MRSDDLLVMAASCDMSAAAGDSGVFHFETGDAVSRQFLGSKSDGFGFTSVDPQIAPGIDASLRRAMALQLFDSPVDGIALGDAAHIDPERAAKPHAVILAKLDVAPGCARIGRLAGIGRRQHSPFNELPRHRDVETAFRRSGDLARP